MWSELYMLHDIYARVTSFSSIALLLPCTSPAASSPALTPFLPRLVLPVPTRSLARSSPRFFLTSLPSLAPRPPRPPFHIHHHHHQHPPIRHPTATYIAARNAESYSVSLDSLKQVLMSCTPTPRPSPTTYPPGHRTLFGNPSATFHVTVTL